MNERTTRRRKGSEQIGRTGKNGKAETSIDPTRIGTPGSGTSYEHDRVARRRDDRGNPIPFSISYIPPVGGSEDLGDAKVGDLIGQIAEFDPLKAAYLGHLYQDRLRRAYERLQDVRREVEEELKQERGRSISLEEQIRPIVEDLERQQEEVLADPLVKLDERVGLLDDAHTEASNRVAEAGGSYDPNSPTEDCAIRVFRMSSAVVADFLQVPWGPAAPAFKLPTWLVWTMTVLCGALIGISAGVFAGFIEDLFGDIPMLVTWIVLGQVPAIAMRKGIGWAFFAFSESFYLRQPRRKQFAWFLAATLVFGSLLTTAMTVDMHGIFKLAQFQALLSGTDEERISGFVMWCLAAVFTLGYAIYSAYDAMICGRNDAIENSLAAEIERDYLTRSEDRRSQPVVQEALRALNHVRRVMASIAEIRAKVAAISLEFASRIAKVEARGTTYPDELSVDQKHRVQDALQNLIGCQLELDAVLASVLGVARPNGQTGTRPSRSPSEPGKRLGFWTRIRKAIRAR
jgi:hypothetical protein